jgi:chromosome segregation ATPase
MVEGKNKTITELTHQVGGLEKAKYVLSFRTNEIRKELEPKEALADRLKSELQKVDDEYKESKKHNFDLSQKIEKLAKINDTLKK